MQYAFLIWSLALIVIWTIVYFLVRSKEIRHEMLVVSLVTSLLGFSEPLFVPAYWNPPTLFNLAQRTGFDIESLIFAFGIAGLVAVSYELLFGAHHVAMASHERSSARHRWHVVALASPPVILLVFLATGINPIYASFAAFVGAGFFTAFCRPDLIKKMLVSGALFTGFYFVFFLTLVLAYPDYVHHVWNLDALSGILILGVPLEELMFAAGFGFLWSSIYEHTRWYRVMR
ncbi:MAG: lycopene cyclase domain-containing protein [Actinomycetota bacterium]